MILRTCKKTVKSEFKNILLKQYSRYKRFYCRRSEFTVCASTRNSMHLPHLNKLILKRITKSKKRRKINLIKNELNILRSESRPCVGGGFRALRR